MYKLCIGLSALALVAAIGIGPAGATQELDPGGPVTGFVPPAKGMLKCERYMNKRVTLVTQCTLTCHVKNAGMIQKNLPFDDDFCEDTGPASCKAKYDRSLVLLDQSLCSPCIGSSTQESLYPEYRDIAETLNGEIYCDTTNANVPLGGDDTGFVSLNHDIAKCEDHFAKNVFKLIKCLNLKCHRNLADDGFVGKAWNNADCEDADPLQSCKARYEADNLKITGCPPCLDAAHRDQVFLDVQAALDSRNGLVYCAQ